MNDDSVKLILSLDTKQARDEINNLRFDKLNGIEIDPANVQKIKDDIKAAILAGKITDAEAKSLWGSLSGLGKQVGTEAGKGFSDGVNSGASGTGASVGKTFSKEIKGQIDNLKFNKLTGIEVDGNTVKKIGSDVKAGVLSGKISTGEANSMLSSLNGIGGKVGQTEGTSFGKLFGSSLLANLASSGIQSALSGIFGGLGKGFSLGSDFQQQLSGIKALTGATASEMEKIRGVALQAGKDTSFSALESAKGLEELLKAGLDVTQSQEGLKGALDLAAAGGISVADAAEIASTALNTFKADNLTVAQSADILSGAANASASSVGELKFGLAASASVTSAVGMSFKDNATALALFAQNGLKGSDAGTSLKTMFLNLQPSTDKQRTLFRDLGLESLDVGKGFDFLKSKGIEVSRSADSVGSAFTQMAQKQLGAKTVTKEVLKLSGDLQVQSGFSRSAFFNEAGSVRDLSEISGTLRDSMKGMTDAQRLQTMETLFGSDAIRAANILYKEGTEGVEKMAGAMTQFTAADVAGEKLNNFAGKLEMLQGTIETAFILAFAGILPKLEPVLGKLTTFLNGIDFEGFGQGIGNAIGFVIDNFALLSSAFAGIGAGFTVSAIISGFTALSVAITAAGGIAGVFGGIMAVAFAPATLAIVGIGLAVAVAIFAFQNWGTITKTTSALWGQFTTFLSQKWNEATTFLIQKSNQTTTFLSQKWGESTTFLKQKWDEMTTNLKNKANELKTNIDNTVKGIGEAVISFYNNNKPLLDSIFVGLTAYISGKTIPALLQLATTFTINAAQAVAGFAITLTTQTIPSLAQMGVAFLVNGVQSITTFATTLTTQTIPAMVSFGVTLLTQTIPNLIQMGVAFLVNGVQSVVSFAVSITTQAVTALVSFGVVILTQTIPGLVKMAAGFLVTALPAVLAFAGGLIATVIPALVSTGIAILAALGPIGIISIAIAGLYLLWVTNSDKIKAVVGIMANWIGTKMTEAENSIKNAMNNAWDYVRNIDVGKIAADMLNGFVNGIKNGIGGVMSAMKNMADSAVQSAKDNLKIKSPSRVMIEIGSFVGEGMATGIDESVGLVNKASTGLGKTTISGALDGFGTSGFGGMSAPQIINSQNPTGQNQAQGGQNVIQGGIVQENQTPANNPANKPAGDPNQITQKIQETVKKVCESIDELIAKFETGIGEAIGVGTENITKALTEMDEAVVGIFNQINEGWITTSIAIGQNVITGIIQGLSDGENSVYSAIASLETNALKAVKMEIKSREEKGEIEGRGAAMGVGKVLNPSTELIRNFKSSVQANSKGGDNNSKSFFQGSTINVNNNADLSSMMQQAQSFSL